MNLSQTLFNSLVNEGTGKDVTTYSDEKSKIHIFTSSKKNADMNLQNLVSP